jgi:hypothetical protein
VTGHEQYEIDDQGNLVKGDGEDASGGGAAQMSADGRRRFLRALAGADVLGVLFLVGCAIYMPGSRTPLLILAAVYAVISVPIFVFMSRQSRLQVEGRPNRMFKPSSSA